jgi:hypothetical protein
MIWSLILDMILKLLEALLRKDPADMTTADKAKLKKIKKLVRSEEFGSFGQ